MLRMLSVGEVQFLGDSDNRVVCREALWCRAFPTSLDNISEIGDEIETKLITAVALDN